MLRQFISAALMLVLLTIVTGLVYPLAVTGVALVAFPHQARGSLITEGKGHGLCFDWATLR